MSDTVIDPALRRPRRHERRRARRRTWPQRLLLVTLVVLVGVSAGAASVLAYGLWRLDQIERVDLRLASPVAPGEPENWLIVGSDSRDALPGSDLDLGAFTGDGAVGSGQRADTILLARVDSRSGAVDLVSFPRDLWLPIAGTGGEQRINTAYAGGPQRVVDTIEAEFAIPVHHYVEVDFVGFGRLVDAVGGVPVYFDSALRDANSGLDVPAGCQVLDGAMALAFVRSRHLQYDTGSGWSTDGTGDLGRINRQQVFVRRAVDQVAGLGVGDALTLNRLLDVGVDSVTLDRGLGIGQLRELGARFADVDGDGVRSHALPVYPFRTSGGAAVLGLEEAEAQPVLNVFRGLPPGTLVPGLVDDVTVLNATGAPGRAAAVAEALVQLGFEVADVGDAPTSNLVRTTVRHAPGAWASADLVARHLTSGADLRVDPALTGDAVVLEVGADFSTIRRSAEPPGEPPAGVDAGPDPAGPTTSTTAPIGVVPDARARCEG